MATHRERNGAFQIRVSMGYNALGKQIVKSMTWKPAHGMTDLQVKDGLEWQKVLFEEKCRREKFEGMEMNVQSVSYIPQISKGDEISPPFVPESKSHNLSVKEVPFYGFQLLAVQEKKTGKIYAGVHWLCNGIGLTKGQSDRQVMNIQSDVVLNGQAKHLRLKFDAQVRQVLCLDIKYVPLWLAKINITPAMKKQQPELAELLVKYQLEAAEVLAAAFMPQASSHRNLIDSHLDRLTYLLELQHGTTNNLLELLRNSNPVHYDEGQSRD